MREEVWVRVEAEAEPEPPDERGAGQDPPRADWHLKTRVRHNKHAEMSSAVLYHMTFSPDGLTCPHSDAGRAPGSLSLHLPTGVKSPLSLQQHLDLKTNRKQFVHLHRARSELL